VWYKQCGGGLAPGKVKCFGEQAPKLSKSSGKKGGGLCGKKKIVNKNTNEAVGVTPPQPITEPKNRKKKSGFKENG